MYKLILLRHGQSEWNKENRFTGWKDVGLSEQGVEEAKKAGIVLKDLIPPARVLSSPSEPAS